MSEVRISKIQAAQKHIDGGIWMLFRRDDPVVIHTVAMAGFRVLKDLAERERLPHVLDFMIRPGKESEFWGAFNSFANFCKHADRDPYDISGNFRENANDVILLVAVTYYELLGYQRTKEMQALTAWYLMLHPDTLAEDEDTRMAHLVLASGSIRTLPRTEQLAIGLQCLQLHTGRDSPVERLRH